MATKKKSKSTKGMNTVEMRNEKMAAQQAAGVFKPTFKKAAKKK